LKIAVLTRDFSPKAGGAEHYAMSLVEGLSARHEVHVFAQTIEHHWPGVHYHRVSKPFARPRFLNQWWYAWATWRQTRLGFDIVHAHENTWHGNVQTVHVLPVWIHYFALKPHQAQFLRLWCGARAREQILTALKWLNVLLSPRLMSYLWLEHARLSVGGRHASRHITSVSASLTQQLLGCFSLESERVHTLMPAVLGPKAWWRQAQERAQALGPNRWLEVLVPSALVGAQEVQAAAPEFSIECLISPALKARARLELGLELRLGVDLGLELELKLGGAAHQPISQWLLWVGHDDKKKGLSAILHALANLAPTVGLMVVGRGALSASAKALAVNKGVASRVAWLGPMEDVSPAYWACDVLVHPTLEDTFGMVVLEAMSWARAVVVSAPAFCGITAHLTHAQEAWVLDDPTDVPALVQALILTLDESRARGLATQAHAWAQAHTWQSVCEAQEAVYRAVLSPSSFSAPLGPGAGHG